MEQIPFLLTMLAGRWGSSLAGWAIASTIIWYVFPAIPQLRSPGIRVAAIVFVLVIVLAVNGFLSLRKRFRRKALAAAVTGEGERDPREVEAEAAEEVARLRERMKRALARLKRKGKGRELYERPWFVMIGPPGSGKTTALLNSGLHLPLDDDEAPSVRGVGGTRLCDWWFTDEAILIDTAGRYTTQDSDAAVDRAGWHGFLDLLRKTRPRQPINGIMVMLSLPDLATMEPAERNAHARAVRLRINEMSERLRLRLPVYVLLSKADQLHGFDAYFDDLDPKGRAQVWGMTFPLDKGVESFAHEFRLLLRRLDERLVERLQGERAGERRGLIGAFPLQVASIEQPLTEFMRVAFTGSRLDQPPFLRGVYMTSATQQGTPIDRLIGMLAQSFGVDQRRVPSLRSVTGRSYFVTRLLTEVILGEALLVSQKPGSLRRRQILRAAGFSTIAITTVLSGFLLWRAEVTNRITIEQADEAIAAYRQQLSAMRLDPVSEDDLPHVVPLLDAAANLPRGGKSSGAPLFGLSQTAKLEQSDRLAYRHALEWIFLPRLIWRLEQQMRSRFDDADFLYAATRVYLMMGSAGPLTASLVRAWMQSDWEARFPGTLNAPLRERLLHHLDALLSEPLPQIPLDGALVEGARKTFSRVSLAERIYSRIRGDADARAVPEWTPASALGPNGEKLFVRPSGRSLTEGIPGFFTVAGYRDALMRDLPATTREAAAESWVLGHTEQVPTEGSQLAALEDAVVALYEKEFERTWDALLGDLSLAPFRGQQNTIRDLYILSSPQSPMRDLLAGIARELRITTANDSKAAQPSAAKSVLSAAGVASANAAPAPAAALPEVEAHFRPLLDLAGNGGAAPLDNVLRVINQLQQILTAAAPGSAPLPSALQNSGDPAQLLLAEADRQPAPVSGWLRQIAMSGSAILGTATHEAASAAFESGDGPQALCHVVVDGHFPFDAQSRIDAPIDDFSRLFGPGGKFDTYFQTQIKPFVDTRGSQWQPHALGGVLAPVDAETVLSFQRIAAIRDAFFPAGATPQLSFSLSPASGSDPSATLSIGGTSVGKDPNQAASFTWPGGSGLSVATLTFESQAAAQNSTIIVGFGAAPDAGQQPPQMQLSGSWAFFRLLARGRLTSTGNPTLFDLSFDIERRRAAFRLQAGSVRNPFVRNLLRGFRCPIVR